MSIIDGIKKGKYKEQIEKLRNEIDPVKRDRIKRALPAVAISGIFENGHKTEHLKVYSGLIQIDLDKIENVLTIKKILEADKFSFAVFTSPSGNGLKIIVKVNPDIALHKSQFIELESYYEKKYNLKIDPQCKDISRLMFVSFDEDLFFSPDSTQWRSDHQAKLQEAILQTGIIEKFVDGNRNKFVFVLAAKCRDKNIPIEFTSAEIVSVYGRNDFEKDEIETTIKSAYSYTGISNQAQSTANNNSQSEEINTSKFFVFISYLKSNFDFRYNEIQNQIEFKEKNDVVFEELNECDLYTHLRIKNINISMNDLGAILRSKFVARYNPFEEYFESLPKWDGTTVHISNLAGFVEAVDQERFARHFKKALVRCISCSLGRTVNKHAFILVGGQNGGKSTFIRNLCPPRLKEYYSENISTDKDGLISLCENLIINLDELAALQKTETNALKNILSKDAVKVRRPYDKKQSVSKRRANFFGSTNKEEFLNDETGSVRWLCFNTLKIDWSYQERVGIDLVWAQAYALFQNDFRSELTFTEIEENEISNTSYQLRSAELEIIQKHLVPVKKSEKSAEALTATDILERLQDRTTVLHNSNSQKIGKALAELKFERVSERIGESKMPQKVYWVKFLKP